MNFIQVDFKIEPYEEYIADILAAELGEMGFDTFIPVENGLQAFVSSDNFNAEILSQLISDFVIEAEIEYEITEIESKNWNEEWEKHYFEPIIIEDKCIIHSSFHKDIPAYEYDITIDPKMSFGTGHHETTSLVIAELLHMDLSGKKVLDMGCGTSVLAILAAMRGATNLTAIDIDEWCTENSIENIALNKVSGIEVLLGGAELLEGMHFDIILANINRNILLMDMAKYAACLNTGGELYMSGFYSEDIPLIEAEADNNKLKVSHYKLKNNWAVVKTVKQ